MPPKCMLSGSVLTLTPNNEIHFDGGPVASLPIKPAQDAHQGMVEYAVNCSVNIILSGTPGPSNGKITCCLPMSVVLLG